MSINNERLIAYLQSTGVLTDELIEEFERSQERLKYDHIIDLIASMNQKDYLEENMRNALLEIKDHFSVSDDELNKAAQLAAKALSNMKDTKPVTFALLSLMLLYPSTVSNFILELPVKVGIAEVTQTEDEQKKPDQPWPQQS